MKSLNHFFWKSLTLIGFLTLTHSVYADDTIRIDRLLAKNTVSIGDELKLSLKEALEIATENNPNYRSTISRIKQAKALYWKQWTKLLPDLGLSISYFNYQGAFPLGTGFSGNGLPIPINSGIKLYQPQFTVNYPAFKGGEKIFDILIARKHVKASQLQSGLSEQELLFNTAKYYYILEQKLDQLVIQQHNTKEARALLELNQARLDSGAGTTLEVMQSKAQLAKAEQDYIEAYLSAQLTASELNELLNLPALISVIPRDTSQKQQVLIPSTFTLEQLLTNAHESRLDIQYQQQQIRKTKHERNKNISGYLPQANLQYMNGALGNSIDSMQAVEQTNLSVGFNFKNAGASDLTQFVADSAQVNEQQHQLQAQYNLVDKRIKHAFLNANAAHSKISTSRIELEATEKALSDAKERLSLGVGLHLDVIDAETHWVEAQTRLSQAICDYNIAQVNLVFQLGRASIQTLTQGISE